MTITVAIPTWSRPEVAGRTAAEALAQLPPPGRCLVIVQGDEAARARAAEAVDRACRARAEPEALSRLQIVELERPNLTSARNRALLIAPGEIVAFLDDDAVPRPGWLEAITGPLIQQRAELVGGRVHEQPDLSTNAPRLLGGRLTWTGHTRRNYDAPGAGPTQLVRGANFAVRRDWAMRIGGFDPRIRGASHYEDLEFSIRLRRAGGRVWYAGEAVVDHLAVRTGAWWERDALRWAQERSRHMSLVFRRHRPALWPLMASAHLAAALMHLGRRRLPAGALGVIARALLEGRREGSESLAPLEGAS